MIDQNDKEELMESYLTAQAAPVVVASELSDEQIHAVWKELDGDKNWLRTFGYQQFARAVLAAATPAASVPAAASDDELPPLPEPTIEGSVVHPVHKICYRAPVHYTADQMRDYVRTDRASRTAPAVQQPAEGGWIANEGHQPVADDVLVVAMMRDGFKDTRLAAAWAWEIDGADPTDVLWYFPLPAAPTQAEGHSHE